ncbi:TetR family transcriptional regulator [Actinoplanes sp. SE50]|uniref:TetR/AcrR family transcriptional regulator n=1 Tax=unclassified Actinoplanes TaxID=2626549 RepID=UPI00023EC486|nr:MULTISPECIES: TetR/AcrR family transcriptional regulator [unclassified Actinoplanes]AEV84657.1 putative HTH-type transcriptional regulator [Actinoplanes sp. SE50/110]ATO83049.1 TetR family transcriptional regulator [Actinoplanes sp. SE50]SLM00457.1 TetR family transcriptional regulator [Actinoplanes sp. SE50/110]
MMSSRNTPGSRTDDDALLDAARQCVLAVGLRRTTLTDVARRAGVSRMTMYRRWPDMASLVADLMTREWGELALRAQEGAAGRHTRDRLVNGLTTGATRLRHNAVFRRILELDPEVLLPYLVDRRGTSQDRMLALLAETIAAGHADGSVRTGPPALLGRSLLLTLHGFVVSSATMTDEVTEADLDTELRLLLDRYLAP